ncbi:MAG: serine protease [Woeseiaceae bacterium]|nr:serine protease [Woeseiaceae bacterium]
MDLEARLTEIQAQVEGGHTETADSITREYFEQLAGAEPDGAFVVQALEAFRAEKQFVELASLSGLAVRAGVTEPIVYTYYAQGLIDQGLVDAGIALLAANRERAKTDLEFSEFTGLLGRGYKQRYVDAAALGFHKPDDLRRSISCYEEAYPKNRAWHGANLVALLHRAEHDKVDVDLSIKSPTLAAKVVEDIRKQVQGAGRELKYWEIAGIAEASLALREWEIVVGRYTEFVRHEECNAFELGSAMRQLREVWLGVPGGDDPVSMILTQVQVKALSFREGGGLVQHTADDSRRVLQAFDRADDKAVADQFGNLEAIHGDNAQVPARVMRGLIKREDAICRVVDRHKHPHSPSGGTGFMVDPDTFADEIPADQAEDWKHPVLVTNNHVLSNNGLTPSVRIRFADAVFDSLNLQLQIEKILWESPRDELDIAIAKLDWSSASKMPGTIPLNLDKEPLADCSGSHSTEKVYVVGHPQGRELAFSLSDNQVVDHDFVKPSDPRPTPRYQRIHYKAPTEQGNSGGPVLEERDFEAIGVHRCVASGPIRNRPDLPVYKANEAVATRSIKKFLVP